MSEKENQTSENAKLYELGFHIIPTVAEQEVAATFSHVEDIINKNHGSIVKAGEPKALKLAYTIVKKIGTKNEKFGSAFFAWIKFHAESSEIETIKKAVEGDKNILRYIVVKTVDDDEHSTAKIAIEEEEAKIEAEEAAEAVNAEATETDEKDVQEEADFAQDEKTAEVTADESDQPAKQDKPEAVEEATEVVEAKPAPEVNDNFDEVIDEMTEKEIK